MTISNRLNRLIKKYLKFSYSDMTTPERKTFKEWVSRIKRDKNRNKWLEQEKLLKSL